MSTAHLVCSAWWWIVIGNPFCNDTEYISQLNVYYYIHIRTNIIRDAKLVAVATRSISTPASCLQQMHTNTTNEALLVCWKKNGKQWEGWFWIFAHTGIIREYSKLAIDDIQWYYIADSHSDKVPLLSQESWSQKGNNDRRPTHPMLRSFNMHR